MSLALAEPHAPSELAAVDSWVTVIAAVSKLAAQVCDTEFVPRSMRGNAPAVAAAILHGREVGLAPMTALSLTNVIDGRVTMSAEGQRTLVRAAGHDIEFTELTDARAVVRGRRKAAPYNPLRGTAPEPWLSVEWTLDRARRAGLGGSPKSAWRTYPRAMLAARASAELCRLMFSDVLHGLAASEEIAEPESAAAEPASGPTKRVRRAGVAEGAAPAIEPHSGPQRPAEPPAYEPPPPPPERDPEPETPAESDPEPEPEPPTIPLPPEPITASQLRMLHALFTRFGLDRGARLNAASIITERKLDTTNELSKEQGSHVIDVLATIVRDEGDAATSADYCAALGDRLESEFTPTPGPDTDRDTNVGGGL